MDAKKGGSMGQDSGKRRKASDGRIVRHQLTLRMDVLGDGVERGEVAGVETSPGVGAPVLAERAR